MDTRTKTQKILLIAAVVAVTVFLLPRLLPLLLPFVIGLLVALAAEPAARFLRSRAKLPCWCCTALCVGGILLLAGAAVFFLCRVLMSELTDFTRQLPELLAQLEGPVAKLRSWLEGLVSKLPQRTAQRMTRQISELFSGSSYLMQSMTGRLVGLVSGLLSGMPGLFIGMITSLLSAFFISASLPELRQKLQSRISRKRLEKMTAFRTRLRRTLGTWLLAQLELAGIACAALCLGLALLRVRYWLLLGILIALIDALPVLGAGIVLIPWAIISFLQENSVLGIGLFVLYGCVSVLKAALEPKLVGKKFGLHPLLTLAAFYVGWRLMGAGGMLLFPIGTVLAGQIYNLLKKDNAKTLQAGRNAEQPQKMTLSGE